MNKRFGIILVLFCFLMPACKRKQPYRIPQYTPPYEQSVEEIPQEDEDYVEYDNTNISADYTPSYIYVSQGSNLQSAIYNVIPQMEYGRMRPYVGGAKLIAEMSADAAGMYTSSFYQDQYIYLLPLSRLKLRICDNPDAIYKLALQDVINIDMCSIESSGFSNKFTVTFKVSNKTEREVIMTIPQGQMIEAVKDNVQNVVITENKQVILQPHSSTTIGTYALCAAHHRSDPSGSKGRITPYILTAPMSTYTSQQSIWDYIEEPVAHRMVFYAWGRGPLENGHKSSTGHAFVYVNKMGYFGFGSAHGDWVDDEGLITNHKRQARFAQDSCVIWITEKQWNNIYNLVNELLSNTPRYHMGYYDCTSFVMDIADAAGIYYGNRLFIQTPMGFMEELKKRN